MSIRLNILYLSYIIYWSYIWRHLGAKTRARDRESYLPDCTKSRCWARGSRGSLQGSSIVSIPGFLPSFSFKNKTRGAVDNACRCASVIIKSRRTRGPVTLIPTNGVLRTRRRRCRRSRRRRRLSTSGWYFLSKNAFPRGGLTDARVATRLLFTGERDHAWYAGNGKRGREKRKFVMPKD